MGPEVNEIDAIIARAMEEYARARGTAPDPFASVTPNNNVAETPQESITAERQEELTQEGRLIRENSKSVLVDETTSRFSGASWFSKIGEKSITLAGIGGIGSYVAFLLSRMHPSSIVVYDDDSVEAANLSGQLYSTNNIGLPKVEAITSTINSFSDYWDVVTFNCRFNETSSASDIMICGFDNMEARRTYFGAWLSHVRSLPEEERANCLFIDGRLAAEDFQVLCVQGNDKSSIDRYSENYLFHDEEAEATLCSYKQTTFMANMIGSVIVNLFVNFCANECDPLVPRPTPFFTYYSAETMQFKIVE